MYTIWKNRPTIQKNTLVPSLLRKKLPSELLAQHHTLLYYFYITCKNL